MLDIQINWLLVLAANFLVLMFFLNIILFKPLLKIFKEREETVKGSLDSAKEMNAEKEEGIAKMQKEISDARHKAKEVFEGMKSEGLSLQKAIITDSEAAAAKMLQKAREELRTEMEKARQSLRADVEKFSDEIVGKLVKAA